MQPMRSGSRVLQGAAISCALLLSLSSGRVYAEDPTPLPPYVSDELSVKFISPPTETELEIFQVKYRLEHVRPLLAPRWHLFRIEDGADAAMKAEWVGQDPLVCAIQLSFLGEWAATNRELEDTECEEPAPDSTDPAAVGSATAGARSEDATEAPPPSTESDPARLGESANYLLIVGLGFATLVLVLGSAQTTPLLRSIRRRLAHK